MLLSLWLSWLNLRDYWHGFSSFPTSPLESVTQSLFVSRSSKYHQMPKMFRVPEVPRWKVPFRQRVLLEWAQSVSSSRSSLLKFCSVCFLVVSKYLKFANFLVGRSHSVCVCLLETPKTPELSQARRWKVMFRFRMFFVSLQNIITCPNYPEFPRLAVGKSNSVCACFQKCPKHLAASKFAVGKSRSVCVCTRRAQWCPELPKFPAEKSHSVCVAFSGVQ